MDFDKKIFLICLLLGLTALAFTFIKIKLQFLPPKTDLKKAFVDNSLVWVKIAQTPEQRKQGLSGVKSLAENEGMLFVFETAGIYKFWMKEMNFPLDFIWIRQNKVVDLTENLPAPSPGAPESQIASCRPKTPADMVLELPAGWIKKHQIKIGDKFSY
jgi:uncharacterized membrane protein (UPF0127 family)